MISKVHLATPLSPALYIATPGSGIRVSLPTRLPRSSRGHSPLATFFYLPLESTLMQNRGRGSRLSPLVLIHTFNLSEAGVGSISRSARFLPHAPARYMLGASPTMRFP